MTSPVNTVGKRISLKGQHGEVEVWGKQIPKVILLDRHHPAYVVPRWLARCTRYVDGGDPVVENLEDVTQNALMQRICGWWLPSIGDGYTVMCSWDDLWDIEMTREENIAAYGGRYGHPAREPWTFWVVGYAKHVPETASAPAPSRRKERTRLPMRGDAEATGS